MRRVAMALCLVASVVSAAGGQTALSPSAAATGAVTPALGLAEQERFLLNAASTRSKGVKIGATGTQRATLIDGSITHDASIQTVDESAARYETATRVEFNFRDYWGYNVAAYRLGVMLGLDNIPPSVERTLRGRRAAFTWWIDDVLMDEKARVHSRAFRLSETLRNEKLVQRCERTFFARLKALDAATLKAQLDDYLTDYEQAAVLKRRDLLVARLESIGPAALYDMPR